MKKYNNPKSSVVGYETGTDYILIEFKGGKKYKYTHKSAGKQIVEQMKLLANIGSGLSSYLYKNAKNGYEK